MPDFSTIGVHQFWYDYDKRILYRIVASMERMETWATDTDPLVDDLFTQMGASLEGLAGNVDLKEELVIRILANTHSARAIRLMQYLDAVKPGFASKLLVYAEEQTKGNNKNHYCDLFLKRNLVFEKMQLLSRVFSPERVNLVLRALENANED